MKLSISNLSWSDAPIDLIAPSLRRVGLLGVEVAPTAIWADAPAIPVSAARDFARRLLNEGLTVSGVQSLLYGHPEYQVFDRTCWPAMQDHLSAMFRLAQELQANVAVFGSPRNRQRGELSMDAATNVFVDFLNGLIPTLSELQLILTLEPNAPAYGADFLTHYSQVVRVCDLIDSEWIKPQIDTGCLVMVDEDLVASVRRRLPTHVHVSAPSLEPPPGEIDHLGFREALAARDYQGWLVLEMLPAGSDPISAATSAAQWLAETYSGADL